MTIRHQQNKSKGAFFIEIDGKTSAQLTYSWAGADKIIIDHTEVDESLKGQGIGYKLVDAAVDFARNETIKILPLCPFAKAVFEKKSNYKDVLF